MQTEADFSGQEIIDNIESGFLEYLFNLDFNNVSDMLATRAIPSFLHSIRKHGVVSFSEDVIKLWMVDMLIDGLKPSTVRRYTGALHTLYKEWIDGQTGVVDNIIFTIPLVGLASDDTGKKLAVIEKNLKSVEALDKVKVSPESNAYLYIRAFQFLLFNPDASLNDVVTLKFSDKLPEVIHVEDIVTSMRRAAQAKYVFPLQHGKRREPAIVKDLLSELHNTARRVGLTFGSTFSRDSITEIWIAAAVKEGISYSEILGVIQNIPDTYAFLSLIGQVEVSDNRKAQILNAVAEYITDKTPGWFVLRMRSGVTPEAIENRLEEIESPLRHMIQYFYPLRAVKKMVKKKMITEMKPVIPGILFFRLPYDRVTPLIGAIGDLAWCYRTSNNISSPYSVIPKHEMKTFQRCIGEFTADIEMEIISTLPELQEGDKVIIEDGSMLNGQQAIIRKVRSVDGTLTYTLQLSDTAFLRWKELNLPASHISKLEN